MYPARAFSRIIDAREKCCHRSEGSVEQGPTTRMPFGRRGRPVGRRGDEAGMFRPRHCSYPRYDQMVTGYGTRWSSDSMCEAAGQGWFCVQMRSEERRVGKEWGARWWG